MPEPLRITILLAGMLLVVGGPLVANALFLAAFGQRQGGTESLILEGEVRRKIFAIAAVGVSVFLFGLVAILVAILWK